MKPLIDCFEGLLDSDFDSRIDSEVIPKPIEWLIGKLEPIKFKQGSSHEYKHCLVNSADYQTCREQLEDIIFDWRLKGSNKYKITRKTYWDLYKENADVTIVCFTSGEMHKEIYLGVGNFVRGEAFLIDIDSRGPYDAGWGKQEDMVTVKTLMDGIHLRHEVHATLMPGWINNRIHQRYFVFPGYCWDSIKRALLQ